VRAQLLVSSPLRRQRIKPDAKLTHVASSHKPTSAAIKPLLDARDSLPGGRVTYCLDLRYSFTVTEAGKYTPALPLTNRTLYDSPLDSQLTQLFDAHCRLLYTGDAVPDEVALSKGDHSARIVLRHESRPLLEKLKGTCMVRG
jgi:tripeptidyl-peptidase-2